MNKDQPSKNERRTHPLAAHEVALPFPNTLPMSCEFGSPRQMDREREREKRIDRHILSLCEYDWVASICCALNWKRQPVDLIENYESGYYMILE